MKARVAAALALLVAVASVAAVVPAGGAVAASASAANGTNNSSNASLGASVSAFMQASAADAEGHVDNGMFAAKFNSTANESAQARLVHSRVDTLQKRLDDLRAQRAALLNDSDGDGVTVAERAKAARLAARINALQNAINQTDRAAERAGVNVTELRQLRENARNLSGPEVAALATGLVDNPGKGPLGAPAADRGQGNTSDGQHPDARTNQTDRRNTPRDGQANTSQSGQPADPGSGNSNSTDSGSTGNTSAKADDQQ